MKYKAVLFDLDGTLLNTLKDIATSMNHALSRLGFPQHKLEACKYFIGSGREAMALRALPDSHRDPATVVKLANLIFEEYGKHWADSTHPYDGIPALLDSLTARGIKMVILSNKPHDSTEMTVSRLLPKWSFEVVMGAQPSLPAKPDPTSAFQIARRIDVRPEEFLFLGDSDTDMETATAAGMYPVGALWGFRTGDELLAGGAKALIEYPTHLLQLL